MSPSEWIMGTPNLHGSHPFVTAGIRLHTFDYICADWFTRCSADGFLLIPSTKNQSGCVPNLLKVHKKSLWRQESQTAKKYSTCLQ